MQNTQQIKFYWGQTCHQIQAIMLIKMHYIFIGLDVSLLCTSDFIVRFHNQLRFWTGLILFKLVFISYSKLGIFLFLIKVTDCKKNILTLN